MYICASVSLYMPLCLICWNVCESVVRLCPVSWDGSRQLPAVCLFKWRGQSRWQYCSHWYAEWSWWLWERLLCHQTCTQQVRHQLLTVPHCVLTCHDFSYLHYSVFWTIIVFPQLWKVSICVVPSVPSGALWTDLNRVVGLKSWTWTRVQFLADLDLDLDSMVKDSDLDLDLNFDDLTTSLLPVYLTKSIQNGRKKEFH